MRRTFRCEIGSFLAENGSIDGGITCSLDSSTQEGAKAWRENTNASTSSRYGRRNDQERSVHSFGSSTPTWHRQTTLAPALLIEPASPAGCGSWIRTTSLGRTSESSSSAFLRSVRLVVGSLGLTQIA